MAHYTKMEQITSFFNLNDSNCDVSSTSSSSSQNKKNDNYLKYKAYNSACLNDPSEGVTFRDILVNQLSSDESKRDFFKKYWGELYDGLNELHESKTYLLSFTDKSSHDTLQMWSLYGDAGTGCCISFKNNLLITEHQLVHEQEIVPKINKIVPGVNKIVPGINEIAPDFSEKEPVFDKIAPDFNKSALKFSKIAPRFSEVAPKFDKIAPEFDEIHNFMNHPYALSVFYHSHDEGIKGEYFYNKLCEHILKLEKEIKKTKQDLDVRKQRVEAKLEANLENLDLEIERFEIFDLEKRIRKINPLVKIILDQVRFLYKDKSHEPEHEWRVVRFADTPSSDIKLANTKDVGDIPALYVDINTNIKYKDVSILLGSKVGNPYKISTYLKHTGVGEVMMSKINFQ